MRKNFVLYKKIDALSKRTCSQIHNSSPLCGTILTRAVVVGSIIPHRTFVSRSPRALLCRVSALSPGHILQKDLYISYQGGALSSLMKMGVVCLNLIVSVVHFLPGVKGKARRKFTSWCLVLLHAQASRTMLSYLASTNFKYFCYIFSLLLCYVVPKACSASARTLTEE